jgi:hypothetical protein
MAARSLCTTIKVQCFLRQMQEGPFVIWLAGIQIRLRGTCGSLSFLSVTANLVKLALFRFPSNAVMISHWLSRNACQHVTAPAVKRGPACQEWKGQVGPRRGSLDSQLLLHKEWMRTRHISPGDDEAYLSHSEIRCGLCIQKQLSSDASPSVYC